MAAATITRQRTNVNGSRREKIYKLTVADTNTLVTGLHLVENVSTCVVASNQEIAVSGISGGTITFAVANGPVTGALVTVLGY